MARPPDLRTLYAAAAITVGTLVLGLVFWSTGAMNPMWAVVAFVLVYDPDAKTAYDSAVSRLLYTFLGCGLSAGAIMLFGVHRWLLPVCLGITVFLCGYFLRFRGAWRAFLVSVVLVVGSSVMEPSHDMRIAGMRVVEVTAGSVLAVLLSLPFRWFDARTKPEN